MGHGQPGPFAHHFHPPVAGPGLAAMKLPTPEELFKQFDTNGDGSLSKDEFVAGVQKIREKIHEMMRSHFGGPAGPHFGPQAAPNVCPPGKKPFAKPAGERPSFGPHGMRSPGGPGDGHPFFGHRGMTPPSAADLIAKFDKNKDGKLTKDEVPAGLWEHISKADTNGDGAVTKDELEAFHKKMHEQFQQRMKEHASAGSAPQANVPAKKAEAPAKKAEAPAKKAEPAPKKPDTPTKDTPPKK
jgi:Ca2+-binding EF-hand superfamily protein